MKALPSIVKVEKPRKFPPGCSPNVFPSSNELEAKATSLIMVEKPRKFPPGCGPNVPRTDAALKLLLERKDDPTFVKNARDAASASAVSHSKTPVFTEQERCTSSISNFHTNHIRAAVEVVEHHRVSEQLSVGARIITNSHPVKKSRLQIISSNRISIETGIDSSRKSEPNPAKPQPLLTSANEYTKSYSKNEQHLHRKSMLEKLNLFRSKCNQLARTESRVDMAAWQELKHSNKIDKHPNLLIGPIPGVEIGDEFHYRVELLIINLHSQLMRGIDYTTHNGKPVATCVVATEGYMDRMQKTADVMTYVGEGGLVLNNTNAKKRNVCGDQKLKGGNLALRNSMELNVPVRVVRGVKKGRLVSRASYIYYGLYMVTNCVKKKLREGNSVYEFELRRLPDQPPVIPKSPVYTTSSIKFA